MRSAQVKRRNKKGHDARCLHRAPTFETKGPTPAKLQVGPPHRGGYPPRAFWLPQQGRISIGHAILGSLQFNVGRPQLDSEGWTGQTIVALPRRVKRESRTSFRQSLPRPRMGIAFMPCEAAPHMGPSGTATRQKAALPLVELCNRGISAARFQLGRLNLHVTM